MADKKKYHFLVGIAGRRQITVRADSWAAADDQARDRLDRIAAERGEEPPVSWTLVPVTQQEAKR